MSEQSEQNNGRLWIPRVGPVEEISSPQTPAVDPSLVVPAIIAYEQPDLVIDPQTGNFRKPPVFKHSPQISLKNKGKK